MSQDRHSSHVPRIRDLRVALKASGPQGSSPQGHSPARAHSCSGQTRICCWRHRHCWLHSLNCRGDVLSVSVGHRASGVHARTHNAHGWSRKQPRPRKAKWAGLHRQGQAATGSGLGPTGRQTGTLGSSCLAPKAQSLCHTGCPSSPPPWRRPPPQRG